MVVLSKDVLPNLQMTVDEYLEADLPEGNSYELVNGFVEMPPAPDIEHEGPRALLNDAFYEYRRTHRDKIAAIIPQATVVITGKNSARQPDIAIYTEWRGKGRGRKAWKELIPLLAVEVVSPDQASRDYKDKSEDYWLAGVSEYWIVDPLEECVTVLNRGKKTWKKTVYRSGKNACSTVLTGFSVSVAGLFE